MTDRRQNARIRNHFAKVDLVRANADFSTDLEHRLFLRLPYVDRADGKRLCVVGQNPSHADAKHADNTVQYIERFVFECFPDVGEILMLNLYSRIDTTKDTTAQPNDPSHDSYLRKSIFENQEFLMIFGELKNKGVYRIKDRVAELQSLFTAKTVLKIDIGSTYAPHPGNPKILYSNFSLGLDRYHFADLNPTNP